MLVDFLTVVASKHYSNKFHSLGAFVFEYLGPLKEHLIRLRVQEQNLTRVVNNCITNHKTGESVYPVPGP